VIAVVPAVEIDRLGVRPRPVVVGRAAGGLAVISNTLRACARPSAAHGAKARGQVPLILISSAR